MGRQKEWEIKYSYPKKVRHEREDPWPKEGMAKKRKSEIKIEEICPKGMSQWEKKIGEEKLAHAQRGTRRDDLRVREFNKEHLEYSAIGCDLWLLWARLLA